LVLFAEPVKDSRRLAKLPALLIPGVVADSDIDYEHRRKEAGRSGFATFSVRVLCQFGTAIRTRSKMEARCDYSDGG
jgi:hypothetical protein